MSLSPSSLVLLLALAPVAFGADSSVTLSGAQWQALQPPEADKPERAPGPMVLRREVRLTPRPDDELVEITVSWQLDAKRPGWLEARLAGPNVQVDSLRVAGRPAPITATTDGITLTRRISGPTRVTLIGVVRGDLSRAMLSLELLEAPIGTVSISEVPGRVAAVQANGQPVVTDGGVHWSGARRLGLRLDKPSPKHAEQVLLIGVAGLGLTVGDTEISAHAHLEWQVVKGEVSSVRFQLQGASADLAVEGPMVASWRRSGDQVVVSLREPTKGLVAVDASWSRATPAGVEAKLALPRVQPLDSWRTTNSVQLARDGQVEVLPQLDGWEAVAASSLPRWAKGLVVGTTTSSYRTTQDLGGDLTLLRFQPVSGPAVMIDVASYDAATTAEGRVLLRAHYAVRNDRGAHLRVTPPAGLHIVGVRVAGVPALPVTDANEGWLIPLQRSVETVEGLLTFPVEVIFLGQEASWARKSQRRFALPRVSADVAVSRLTLHLPPEHLSRNKPGEDHVVDSFTKGEGITYGFAVGDTKAAEADARFQQAVGAWMDNDFDQVQEVLDSLDLLGASNENIRRLQANVDLLEGKRDGGRDTALERRVKEQAQARSVDDAREREEALRAAAEAEAAGRYDKAEAAYRQAYDAGEKLKKLEQHESVELSLDNASVGQKLAAVTKKKGKSISTSKSAGRGPASSKRGEVLSKEVLDIIPVGRDYQSAVQSRAPADAKDNGVLQMFDDSSLDLNSLLDGKDITGIGAFGGGETGSVEGGVVGGVLGGVLNGVGAGGGGASGYVGGMPGDIAADDVAAYDEDLEFAVPQEDPAPMAKPMPAPSITLAVEESRHRRHPQKTRGKPAAPPPPPAAASPTPPPKAQHARGNKRSSFAFEDAEISGELVTPDATTLREEDAWDKPLEVTAAQLSVIIPTQGQTVRYQHLLLPAGADPVVVVRARALRHHSRRKTP